MRVFYGIPLSGGLVDHFQALLRILEEQKVPKLQSTANLHLTLAFLGEVPVEKIPLLCQAGYEISQTHPQFRLRLGSLGCFGRTPKLTLWQGILASHPLQNLAHDLWLKLEGISYQKEKRPYRPHITLSRRTSSLPVLKDKKSPPSWEVSHFFLFQSQRLKGKLVYTPLKRFQLSKISKIY